jgi:hypothetical protein
MKDNKKPRLFICDHLTNDLMNSAYSIETLVTSLTDENIDMTYLYAFTLFESAVSESARFFLCAFPENLSDKKDYKINPSEIVENLYNPRKMRACLVEKEIKRDRGNAAELFIYANELLLQNQFNSTEFVKSDDYKHLDEISIIRNKIAHESTPSDKYYARGRYGESQSDINRLLSKDDAESDMLFMADRLKAYAFDINKKYNRYSPEYFIESFWNYIFVGSQLSYKSTINIERGKNKKEDSINIFFRPNFEYIERVHKYLSKTEKFYLALILLQYNGSILDEYFKFRELPALVSMSDISKIPFILDVFTLFPWMFLGSGIDIIPLEEKDENKLRSQQ